MNYIKKLTIDLQKQLFQLTEFTNYTQLAKELNESYYTIRKTMVDGKGEVETLIKILNSQGYKLKVVKDHKALFNN